MPFLIVLGYDIFVIIHFLKKGLREAAYKIIGYPIAIILCWGPIIIVRIIQTIKEISDDCVKAP